MVRRNQVEKDPKRNKEKQSYSKNMPRDCNFRLKCLNIQRDKEQKKIILSQSIILKRKDRKLRNKKPKQMFLK